RGFGRLERMHAAQQFERDETVGENVAAGIRLAALKLLRSHVPEGSDHRTPGSEPRVRGLGDQGDSEIHDLYAVIAQQHYVGRFYVAMDDAVGVRVPQSGRHL